MIIHTNLGRAPLSDEAVSAMVAIARGFSNLEFDLERGERGSRYSHCGRLLARLSGADDGLVVNNTASSLLLILAGFGRRREVIVSRGQLVEIGGGFRIPDVMPSRAWSSSRWGAPIARTSGTTQPRSPSGRRPSC